MFTFEVDDASLTAFGRRFRAAKLKNVTKALEDIKREYQYEFLRQQANNTRSGRWAPLSVAYFIRKEREYSDPDFPEVRYLSLLRRTGEMLEGYVQGVMIDNNRYTVTANFPARPDLRKRAKSHQGVIGLPKGGVARPFNLQRFDAIAKKIMKDALVKNNG